MGQVIGWEGSGGKGESVMSSKMLAGLIAGGFGAALSVALVFTEMLSPFYALLLMLTLLFGLGMLSGALAAAWLDLADYGRQSAVGALAGLVAGAVTEVCDLVLRLVWGLIGQSSPTNALSSLIVSRLPASTGAALIAFLVIVNLVLYLVYLLIVVGISGLTTSLVGRAKTPQALQALLGEEELLIAPSAAEIAGEEPVDPALAPFLRPEYSPFVPQASAPPLSPWQQRRLERERQLSGEDGSLPAQADPLTSQSKPPALRNGQPSSQGNLPPGKKAAPANQKEIPTVQKYRPGGVTPPGSAQPGQMPLLHLPTIQQRFRPRGKGR